MKRAFSIFLLFLFLYNIAGYLPVYFFQKEEAQREMKNKMFSMISSDKLTELVFEESEFLRLEFEEESEFSFKNTMYDLVRMTKDENGKVHVFCVSDTRESELLAHFEKQESNTSDSNQSSPNEMGFVKLLCSDFVNTDLDFSMITSSEELEFLSIASGLCSHFFLPDSPPPRLS